jgi:hypothetical protein
MQTLAEGLKITLIMFSRIIVLLENENSFFLVVYKLIFYSDGSRDFQLNICMAAACSPIPKLVEQ